MGVQTHDEKGEELKRICNHFNTASAVNAQYRFDLIENVFQKNVAKIMNLTPAQLVKRQPEGERGNKDEILKRINIRLIDSNKSRQEGQCTKAATRELRAK